MARDPVLRGILASTTPWDLLRQWRFWRRQRAFLSILAGALALVLVLAPYTYAWAGGWGLISVAVQGLALWGVWILAWALVTLEVDSALVGEMEVRGNSYLVDLKAGRRACVDLDRLEETMVPNNPSVPSPGPIRLFQHICKEARDRRFDSGSTLVQPYREESLEDVFRLQNLQKIALWLGILGTFIGLLVALEQHEPDAMGDGTALLGMVEKMYGGLFISFTASVAGLEVAIILSFLLLLLRKRQERYFAQLESAVVTLLSVARHAINRDDFLAEFSQVNVALRELTRRVYDQTQELGEGLANVHLQLAEQNQRIGTGLDRLARAGGEFDGFLQRAGAAQQAFLRDLARLFEVASFNDFTRALEAGVKGAGSEVAGQLERLTVRNSAQLTAFTGAVEVLERAVQAQSQTLAAAVQALGTKLGELPAGAPAALSADLRRLAEETRTLNATMERLAVRGSRPGILSALAEWVRRRERPTAYGPRAESAYAAEAAWPRTPAAGSRNRTADARGASPGTRPNDG